MEEGLWVDMGVLPKYDNDPSSPPRRLLGESSTLSSQGCQQSAGRVLWGGGGGAAPLKSGDNVQLQSDTQAFVGSVLAGAVKTVPRLSAINPGTGWAVKDPPTGVFVALGCGDALATQQLHPPHPTASTPPPVEMGDVLTDCCVKRKNNNNNSEFWIRAAQSTTSQPAYDLGGGSPISPPDHIRGRPHSMVSHHTQTEARALKHICTVHASHAGGLKPAAWFLCYLHRQLDVSFSRSPHRDL
ncbi:unnamed protein product [Pleuronectes platessa]|uniref:Uncharacterized protein n=1 Tax=Pleuronectes platessa TaxID=8262 RepID=A0A9N7Z961_PLEPL|nr:unnamed protein product [Pleuronectes platessa]